MHLLTFFRTLRHLHLRQIIARFVSRFRPIYIGHVEGVSISVRRGPWVEPVPRFADVISSQHFRLLNQEVTIRDPKDWNAPNRDKLLLYHLHYFDVLNCRDRHFGNDKGNRLIERWIVENPACKGNGWEPYPLSIRIVNWIKWQLSGNCLSELATRSLFLQTRVLAQKIEYHLLANHLIANAKALYFSALFFRGHEAIAWKKVATELLNSELQIQILKDGGHFELSPMYHSIVVEDLLDILNLACTFDDHSIKDIARFATKMLNWLKTMTQPDGRLPYFNDSVNGSTASLSQLQEYASRLGVEYTTTQSDGLTRLSASGYIRFQCSDATIFIDVGEIGPDYQPGHGHCDLFSFEMTIGTQRHLVNTGISTYNVGNRRHAERSTESHNTVMVLNEEQSEIWKGFRVGRRARPINIRNSDGYLQAAHDGYMHIGVVHKRRFDFFKGYVLIRDILESLVPSTGVAHFHFHPSIGAALNGHSVKAGQLKLTFENCRTVDLTDYEYCLGFNLRMPAKKLTVAFDERLSTRIDYESPICNG